MRTGAVPVTLDRLRVERGGDAEVLGDPVEQPAGHPQLVGDVERAQRADLELPLARHDLGVDARDAEAGVEARLEVRLDDVTAEDLVGADAAVVEGLRRGEAVGREAERAAVLEERVLLLDAEDRLLVGELLGDRAQQRPRCSSRAASCRAAAPRTSRARCRRRGSGPGTTHTGWSTQSELLARRLVGARPVEAPDRRAPCRRRGSWSSTGAGASARCRRSRCTRPCRSRSAPVSSSSGRSAPGPTFER